MIKEIKLNWTSSEIGNQPLSLSCPRVKYSPSKRTFYLNLGCSPTLLKSSNQGYAAHHFPLPAQTDHSAGAPNPKTFRARIRRWEGSIPLLAGTLKLAVITVSIWLVYGTDHLGWLPEPDSAHYILYCVLDVVCLLIMDVCSRPPFLVWIFTQILGAKISANHRRATFFVHWQIHFAFCSGPIRISLTYVRIIKISFVFYISVSTFVFNIQVKSWSVIVFPDSIRWSAVDYQLDSQQYAQLGFVS